MAKLGPWRRRAALAAMLLLSTPALGQERPPPEAEAPPAAKPAPRVLVLTFGRADQGELGAVVQGAAEQVFLDLRFPLVDETQLTSVHQLDDLERFLILSPERARMAEIRSRFGADVLVVIQYTRRFQYEKDFYGARTRFFKNDVRVKAIAPDTAELLFSGGAEGEVEARQSNLEALSKAEVRRCAEKLLERMSYASVTPSTFQVVVTGIDRDRLERLTAALRSIPSVREAVVRDHGGPAVGAGSALVEVKYRGSVDELAGALGSMTDPALEVRKSSGARIEVAPRASGAPPGAEPAAEPSTEPRAPPSGGG